MSAAPTDAERRHESLRACEVDLLEQLAQVESADELERDADALERRIAELESELASRTNRRR